MLFVCSLSTTDNILNVHLTVNIATKKIIHVRNNNDWSFIFTIEVIIMFTASCEHYFLIV